MLSRKLRIHVNEAKKCVDQLCFIPFKTSDDLRSELNRYYEKNKSSDRPLHATFMVTGETRASGSAEEDEMEVDAPVDAVHATQLKCLIVDESNLEGACSVRQMALYILTEDCRSQIFILKPT